tara:strand:+ start:694 stop:1434 length:741 start_codon:yes stop_codon:yes gene_type:complete
MTGAVSAGKACVPPGRRVYAVGDIHGRVDLLRRLNSRILADAERSDADSCVVVYLGDYVDRGGHSREVLENLIMDPIPHFDCFSLMGNHEAFLLEFLDNPGRGEVWLFNGGDTTLRNYGVEVGDPEFYTGGWEWLRDRFLECLPQRHLDLLRSLPLMHVEGDYAFVHAGIRPGVPLADQSREDLLWIREGFLDHEENLEKVVVHGHTSFKEIQVESNRISIDTGAWMSDTLTCVVLHDNEHAFIQT